MREAVETSTLSYFDGYRSERLPANLLQAQRDYFGAHTYECTDRACGEFFRTNWTGRGGDTASSTYSAQGTIASIVACREKISALRACTI